MKILVVAYYDDNFGDMLIRICFKRLLYVVLKNLGVEHQIEIDEMSLKQIDEIKLKTSDLIFFAGGGLFGLSYLNFFEYLDEITKLADLYEIPVVFSSVGVNNMDATDENEIKLYNLLNKKCIKGISVRENASLFRKYLKRKDITIIQVCDPAIWTKYIYHIEQEKKANKTSLIGINVVRSGLFKDNTSAWKEKDYFDYLCGLSKLAEDNKIDYRFYTNGSFLDDNTMKYFAEKRKISNDKIIFHNTTRELVEIVSQFDAVAAIRMHSAILAYSYEIPAVCLVWNDKIPLFYQSIGMPERAMKLKDWNAQNVFHMLNHIINSKNSMFDQSYAMTLYNFLFDILKKMIRQNSTEKTFDFQKVVEILNNLNNLDNHNIDDFSIKLERAEKQYYKLYKMKKKRR